MPGDEGWPRLDHVVLCAALSIRGKSGDDGDYSNWLPSREPEWLSCTTT